MFRIYMKYRVLIAILALVAVIAAAAFLVYRAPSEQEPAMSTAPRADVLGLRNKVLKETANNIPAWDGYYEIERDEDVFLWWIGEDGYSTYNTAYEALIVIKEIGVASYDFPENDPAVSAVISTASAQFQNNGYVENRTNYSGPENEYALYDYIKSYENADEVCSIVVNRDAAGFGAAEMSIGCVARETVAENLQEQKPFLDALGLRHEGYIVYNIQNAGNAYRVSVGLRRTGYYAILVEQDGGLEKIYEGQEFPECALFDEYEVPVELVESCFEEGATIDRETGKEWEWSS